MFDDKEIINFMNLPFEKTDEVAAKCVWYDILEAELLEVLPGSIGRKVQSVRPAVTQRIQRTVLVRVSENREYPFTTIHALA